MCLTTRETIPANSLTIRNATDTDMDQVTAIYRHHVLTGTASFEEIPPGIDEITNRFQAIRDKGMPYLVAIRGDVIVGYCYASSYRPRTAYRHTVENSIYVAPDCTGQGIGSLLMEHLIARCEAGPWRQMIAAIGDSANHASIALHRKHGFEPTGVFHKVGFKFDRWLDSVLMQRPLGEDKPSLPGPTGQ
ncbi:GNAT family N-acetyltransferase [Thalassospira profundimaris]|uniref:GCN5 family acetyltransferase n=1 Tax=Thalassospira profundimaris TaxID=502049 RepID=A0A367WRH7_9PROT|nr:GNAT family N-acetyltransferase [Thalassospira profundimaris]RCK44053.1 GCN5 family acetyltransferase [Thalassospira profundimaris]